MQPTAAIAALNPTVAVDPTPVDDWDRPRTDWETLSFNTPLNVQVPADMFARIHTHATAEGEDEEEYVGNELLTWVSLCEALDEHDRQEKQDPERYQAGFIPNDEFWEGMGIDDDDDDEDAPEREANLEDVDDGRF